MENILGIDIAKAKFDVALLRQGKFKEKVFHNHRAGFEALEGWLKTHGATTVTVCMEATGAYWEALATFLHEAGYRVSVVNPAQIQAYRRASAVRSKTDSIDAKLIARFAASQTPLVWTPPLPELRVLIALVRDLQYLKDARGEEENRLGTAHPEIIERIGRHLAFLEAEVQRVQRAIADHIGRHPQLKASRDLLDSIPGISTQTIPWLISLLGNGARFDSSKQAASFLGLDPRLWQSGSSVRGKACISKTGHADLRRALYMPGVVAFSRVQVFQPFVARLKAAGKPPKVIIVALMRKLVTIAWAVLKYRKPFDPAVWGVNGLVRCSSK